jgi:hypothetical protein
MRPERFVMSERDQEFDWVKRRRTVRARQQRELAIYHSTPMLASAKVLIVGHDFIVALQSHRQLVNISHRQLRM